MKVYILLGYKEVYTRLKYYLLICHNLKEYYMNFRKK